MAKTSDYSRIDRPYDGQLYRSVSEDYVSTDSMDIGEEWSPIDGAQPDMSDDVNEAVITDSTLDSWLRSSNYRPNSSGLRLDGPKGEIDAQDLWIGGTHVGEFRVTAKSANYAVMNYECGGCDGFTNEGATGPIKFSLPSAKAGFKVTFLIDTAKQLKIRADWNGSSDVIHTSTVASAHMISCSGKGSSIVLTAVNDNEWIGCGCGTWEANTSSSTTTTALPPEVAYVMSGGQIPPGTFCGNTDEYNPDVWANKTDIPSPKRVNSASCTINDKAYITGGGTGYNPMIGVVSLIQDTDEYDPDVWTSKTDMPSPARQAHAASTIVNKGYYYAGYSSSSVRMQDCDEYDPDTWTSKTNMPSPARWLLAASTINNKGYVYGGRTTTDIGDIDEYDPDTWTSKTNMPSPTRQQLTASTINNKGYIYGGYDGASNLQDCDEYNPDTWINKADMPSPARYGHSSSTIDNAGYCVAGNAGILLDNDEYEPIANTWTSKTSMPYVVPTTSHDPAAMTTI